MTYGFVVPGNPHDVLPARLPLPQLGVPPPLPSAVTEVEEEEEEEVTAARRSLLVTAGWSQEEAEGVAAAGLLRLRPLRVLGLGEEEKEGGRERGKRELQVWAKDRAMLWAAAVAAFALPAREARAMAKRGGEGGGEGGNERSWSATCDELRRAFRSSSQRALGAGEGVVEESSSGGSGSNGDDCEKAARERARMAVEGLRAFVAGHCSRGGAAESKKENDKSSAAAGRVGGGDGGGGGSVRAGVARCCAVYTGAQDEIAATVVLLCEDALGRLKSRE